MQQCKLQLPFSEMHVMINVILQVLASYVLGGMTEKVVRYDFTLRKELLLIVTEYFNIILILINTGKYNVSGLLDPNWWNACTTTICNWR